MNIAIAEKRCFLHFSSHCIISFPLLQFFHSMPARSYSIRNYSSKDFEKFVTFCVETQALGEKEGRTVSALIRKKFKKPSYSPSQDLFLVLWQEKIVGFLDMTPELRIERIILDVFIHPRHRRQGLATQMYRDALKRAKRAEGKILHMCVPEKNRLCISFLKKLSFSLVQIGRAYV